MSGYLTYTKFPGRASKHIDDKGLDTILKVVFNTTTSAGCAITTNLNFDMTSNVGLSASMNVGTNMTRNVEFHMISISCQC